MEKVADASFTRRSATCGGGSRSLASAARHFLPGDRVIIAAFALTDEAVHPK